MLINVKKIIKTKENEKHKKQIRHTLVDKLEANGDHIAKPQEM